MAKIGAILRLRLVVGEPRMFLVVMGFSRTFCIRNGSLVVFRFPARILHQRKSMDGNFVKSADIRVTDNRGETWVLQTFCNLCFRKEMEALVWLSKKIE